MVWRENYYACEANKVKIALQNKQISSKYRDVWRTGVKLLCLTGKGNLGLVQNIGNLKEKKNREFEKSWFYCTSLIALNNNMRDGLKNPRLAQPEAACRLIHCRPFAHDWPLNFPPEDETLINGSLEGMYPIVFACWNVDGAYKCLLCSSLTTDFSMHSCRNRIRIRFWFLSMSFRFYIFNFKLRNTKIYYLIASYISNV